MLKPNTKNKNYEIIPAGNHLAILIQIIDMGHQEVTWEGKTKMQPRIRLTWELPDENKEFDGVTKPLVIGAQYTNSMGSLARLRPIVEGMLGVQLRDEEAANFDMDSYEELLGKPCSLTVMHKLGSDGKTYANVATVAPLMKGVIVPKQFNESLIYEIGTSSDEVFQKLPEFIRKQIMKAEENQTVDMDDNNEELERVMKGDNKVVSEKTESEIMAESIPF